jgi:hypothetical protein
VIDVFSRRLQTLFAPLLPSQEKVIHVYDRASDALPELFGDCRFSRAAPPVDRDEQGTVVFWQRAHGCRDLLGDGFHRLILSVTIIPILSAADNAVFAKSP